MPESQIVERDAADVEQAMTLIDCDIHPAPASNDDLYAHLSDRARQRIERGAMRNAQGANYPRIAHGGNRVDTHPEEGTYPGSSLELLQRQLLDEYGIAYGIMHPFNYFEVNDPQIASEGARAMNEWQVEHWIEREDRLLGSICLPWEFPDLAVAEIERRAGERHWAQVYVPGELMEPLGSRKYWPVYEAATAAGLPVAMHLAGWENHLGAGWPSYYFEEHVYYATCARRQVLNLVSEGLFEAVPDLRMVMTEGGVAWATPLRWAVDSAWELLRDELPLTRRPSEYLDEHVWYTTQPIEEPDDPQDFARMVAHGHLEGRLLFATDYPHWDFDSPAQALPRSLSAETRRGILGGNAAKLYGLPR